MGINPCTSQFLYGKAVPKDYGEFFGASGMHTNARTHWHKKHPGPAHMMCNIHADTLACLLKHASSRTHAHARTHEQASMTRARRLSVVAYCAVTFFPFKSIRSG